MTEPERPQVTVSGPLLRERTGASADVLAADGPRRRLPLWVTPLAIGGLLAGLCVPPVVAAVRHDRREDRAVRELERAREAERARDDAVSLRLSDLRLSAGDDVGSLRLSVVATTGGSAVTADALRLTGDLVGGTREAWESQYVDLAEAPPEVGVTIALDCAAVRDAVDDGRAPTGVSVVALATPQSGRQQQSQPLPLPDALLRGALLDACRLGDPDVAPSATVDVVDGHVLVEATTGRGPDTTLVGFRLAGVAVRPSTTLPLAMRRTDALLIGLGLGRVDCARFTGGPLLVLFRGADGQVREVPAAQGTRPGSTSFGDLLARLKRTRCP